MSAVRDSSFRPSVARGMRWQTWTMWLVLALALPSCTPRGSTPTGEVLATAPPVGTAPTVSAAPATPTGVALALPRTVPLEPDGDLDLAWLLYSSANDVTELLFDGRWIWAAGRNGGLTRWDPQRLESVRHTSARGFPLESVLDMDADPEGRALYAVGQGGLAIWDTAQWHHFDPEELGFTAGSTVSAVAVESSSRLWLGARPAYVFEADPQGLPGSDRVAAVSGGGVASLDWSRSGHPWEFEASLADVGLPYPISVNDMDVDPAGNLWVAYAAGGGSEWIEAHGLSGGLRQRTPDGEWIEDPGGAEYDQAGPVQAGIDGTLYTEFGSYGYFPVLAVRPPDSGDWSLVEDVDVATFAVDPMGHVLVGGRDGVLELTPRGPDPVAGADAVVVALTVDGEGNLWYATEESGLYELVGGTASPRVAAEGLPGNIVHAVAANGDGSLWVQSGGIVDIEVEGGSRPVPWFHTSRILEERITTYADERQAIEAAYPWTTSDSLWPVDSLGGIWVEESGSLSRYDGNGWTPIPPPPGVDTRDLRNLNYVWGERRYLLRPGPNGQMAVVAWSHERQSNSLSIYEPGIGWQATADDLDWVGNLAFDAAGQVWLTQGDTVYASSSVDGSLTASLELERANIYMPTLGLARSPQGEVWALGEDGELFVHREARWQKIAQLQGGNELFFAPDGELFATTEVPCGHEGSCFNGLMQYDGERWTRYLFDQSDLLSDVIIDAQVNAGSGASIERPIYGGLVYDVTIDADGDLWIATNRGLQRIPASSPPISSGACPGAPPSRMTQGSAARVTLTDGTPLAFRTEPGVSSANHIRYLDEGTRLTILDGPVCTGGYAWWHVQTEDGTTGWVAEGDSNGYYIEPLD